MKRFQLALLALVCAAGATGCVTSRYGCPDPGDGVAWYHVKSNHLDVRTDMDPERAEHVVRELERAWAAQDRVSGGPMLGLQRVRLVMLRNSGEMERFTDERWAYWRPEGEAAATILADPQQGNALGRGAHPAVTAMGSERAARAYPDAPRWLIAGIGRFLGTMAPQPGSREVHVGMPDADYLRLLAMRPPMTLAQLWAAEGRVQGMPREEHYWWEASTWLWVHYLALQQDQRFGALQRLVAHGVDARQAWAHVFEGLSDEALTTAVMQHAAAGGRRYFVYPQQPLQVDVQVERMAPADVHALHARLRMYQAKAKPDATAQALGASDAELAVVQQRDPENASALLVRLERAGAPEPGTVAALQRALATSDDEDAWRALPALVKGVDGDLARAHVDAATHLPRDERVQYDAAVYLLGQRRAQDALPFVQRAVELSPTNVYALDAQAYALAELGRCTDAAAAATRALEVAPRGTQAYRQAEERLYETRTRCRAPEPAPTPVPARPAKAGRRK